MMVLCQKMCAIDVGVVVGLHASRRVIEEVRGGELMRCHVTDRASQPPKQAVEASAVQAGRQKVNNRSALEPDYIGA
jgi:hypothetical protein